MMVYFGVFMVFELVFGFLVSFIIMWYSCYCEFYVDVGVVQLVGKYKMIVVLECLKMGQELYFEGLMMVFGIIGKCFLFELMMIYLFFEKCIVVLCNM